VSPRTLGRALGAAAALALAAAAGACTDKDLAVTEPGRAPGTSAATREVFLRASDFGAGGWFDTTLVGFATPDAAAFLLAAEESGFRSRALLRFTSIPSQVAIGDTLREAREFVQARLLVRPDSARSSFPNGGVLSLYDAEQAFDALTATWTFAVDTPGGRVPWSQPGGALGAPIASAAFGPTAFRDTVVVDGDTILGFIVLPFGARSDSLLRAWGDTANPHPGLVLAVEAAGDARVEFLVPVLQYRIVPDVSPDTSVRASTSPSAATFIFDPPLPEPGPRLGVGGLPAARAYVEVRLPDTVSVDGEQVRLRGVTVNRADLLLTSRPLDPPHALEREVTLRAFRVADDVRRFGPKTPLGAEVGEAVRRLAPDSLAEGATLRVPLTSLVQAWASTPPDSTPLPLRVVLRAEPEAAAIGRAAFAGAGEPGEPVLRIVFTPPTEFTLP
jgi:hypothetical protein